MSKDAPVTIAGNLGDDPELRYTASGVAVATLRVALREAQKQADGSWSDGLASWISVNVWRELGEHVAESLRKGDRVIATGHLAEHAWEAEGGKRSRLEMTADEVGASLRFVNVAIEREARRQRHDANVPPAGVWEPPPRVDADVPF